MSTAPELLQVPRAAIRHAPQLQSHVTIPSTIRKSAVFCQLAIISRGKLQQEAASHMPNLRRCIGHHGVFQKCVKAAQENHQQQRYHSIAHQETTTIITSSSSKSDSNNAPPFRVQVTTAIKTMVQLSNSSAEIPRSVEDKDLVRVNARNEVPRHHHFSSRIIQRLKSFSRHKPFVDDKALG